MSGVRRSKAATCVALVVTLVLLVVALVSGGFGRRPDKASAPGAANDAGASEQNNESDDLPAETQGSNVSAGSGHASGETPDENSAAKSGSTSVYTVEEEVPEAATQVLRDYEDSGSCVLARAGYVDLLGRTWSCTVVGDRWVDTVVVRSLEDGAGSEVRTVRMVASEWEDEVEGL